jgi:hypothetical protein
MSRLETSRCSGGNLPAAGWRRKPTTWWPLERPAVRGVDGQARAAVAADPGGSNASAERPVHVPGPPHGTRRLDRTLDYGAAASSASGAAALLSVMVAR